VKRTTSLTTGEKRWHTKRIIAFFARNFNFLRHQLSYVMWLHVICYTLHLYSYYPDSVFGVKFMDLPIVKCCSFGWRLCSDYSRSVFCLPSCRANCLLIPILQDHNDCILGITATIPLLSLAVYCMLICMECLRFGAYWQCAPNNGLEKREKETENQ